MTGVQTCALPISPKLPADRENDYTPDMAAQRRDFIQEQTGASLHHVGQFSFDPSVLPGNIERFAGVAQVPIGLAGPLAVRGEWANGDFYVPMATTEGTLVASYNRGMKLTREAGGILPTVCRSMFVSLPTEVVSSALALIAIKLASTHVPKSRE